MKFLPGTFLWFVYIKLKTRRIRSHRVMMMT